MIIKPDEFIDSVFKKYKEMANLEYWTPDFASISPCIEQQLKAVCASSLPRNDINDAQKDYLVDRVANYLHAQKNLSRTNIDEEAEFSALFDLNVWWEGASASEEPENISKTIAAATSSTELNKEDQGASRRFFQLAADERLKPEDVAFGLHGFPSTTQSHIAVDNSKLSAFALHNGASSSSENDPLKDRSNIVPDKVKASANVQLPHSSALQELLHWTQEQLNLSKQLARHGSDSDSSFGDLLSYSSGVQTTTASQSQSQPVAFDVFDQYITLYKQYTALNLDQKKQDANINYEEGRLLSLTKLKDKETANSASNKKKLIAELAIRRQRIEVRIDEKREQLDKLRHNNIVKGAEFKMPIASEEPLETSVDLTQYGMISPLKPLVERYAVEQVSPCFIEQKDILDTMLESFGQSGQEINLGAAKSNYLITTQTRSNTLSDRMGCLAQGIQRKRNAYKGVLHSRKKIATTYAEKNLKAPIEKALSRKMSFSDFLAGDFERIKDALQALEKTEDKYKRRALKQGIIDQLAAFGLTSLKPVYSLGKKSNEYKEYLFDSLQVSINAHSAISYQTLVADVSLKARKTISSQLAEDVASQTKMLEKVALLEVEKHLLKESNLDFEMNAEQERQKYKQESKRRLSKKNLTQEAQARIEQEISSLPYNKFFSVSKRAQELKLKLRASDALVSDSIHDKTIANIRKRIKTAEAYSKVIDSKQVKAIQERMANKEYDAAYYEHVNREARLRTPKYLGEVKVRIKTEILQAQDAYDARAKDSLKNRSLRYSLVLANIQTFKDIQAFNGTINRLLSEVDDDPENYKDLLQLPISTKEEIATKITDIEVAYLSPDVVNNDTNLQELKEACTKMRTAAANTHATKKWLDHYICMAKDQSQPVSDDDKFYMNPWFEINRLKQCIPKDTEASNFQTIKAFGITGLEQFINGLDSFVDKTLTQQFKVAAQSLESTASKKNKVKKEVTLFYQERARAEAFVKVYDCMQAASGSYDNWVEGIHSLVDTLAEKFKINLFNARVEKTLNKQLISTQLQLDTKKKAINDTLYPEEQDQLSIQDKTEVKTLSAQCRRINSDLIDCNKRLKTSSARLLQFEKESKNLKHQRVVYKGCLATIRSYRRSQLALPHPNWCALIAHFETIPGGGLLQKIINGKAPLLKLTDGDKYFLKDGYTKFYQAKQAIFDKIAKKNKSSASNSEQLLEIQRIIKARGNDLYSTQVYRPVNDVIQDVLALRKSLKEREATIRQLPFGLNSKQFGLLSRRNRAQMLDEKVTKVEKRLFNHSIDHAAVNDQMLAFTYEYGVYNLRQHLKTLSVRIDAFKQVTSDNSTQYEAKVFGCDVKALVKQIKMVSCIVDRFNASENLSDQVEDLNALSKNLAAFDATVWDQRSSIDELHLLGKSIKYCTEQFLTLVDELGQSISPEAFTSMSDRDFDYSLDEGYSSLAIYRNLVRLLDEANSSGTTWLAQVDDDLKEAKDNSMMSHVLALFNALHKIFESSRANIALKLGLYKNALDERERELLSSYEMSENLFFRLNISDVDDKKQAQDEVSMILLHEKKVIVSQLFGRFFEGDINLVQLYKDIRTSLCPNEDAKRRSLELEILRLSSLEADFTDSIKQKSAQENSDTISLEVELDSVKERLQLLRSEQSYFQEVGFALQAPFLSCLDDELSAQWINQYNPSAEIDITIQTCIENLLQMIFKLSQDILKYREEVDKVKACSKRLEKEENRAPNVDGNREEEAALERAVKQEKQCRSSFDKMVKTASSLAERLVDKPYDANVFQSTQRLIQTIKQNQPIKQSKEHSIDVYLEEKNGGLTFIEVWYNPVNDYLDKYNKQAIKAPYLTLRSSKNNDQIFCGQSNKHLEQQQAELTNSYVDLGKQCDNVNEASRKLDKQPLDDCSHYDQLNVLRKKYGTLHKNIPSMDRAIKTALIGEKCHVCQKSITQVLKTNISDLAAKAQEGKAAVHRTINGFVQDNLVREPVRQSLANILKSFPGKLDQYKPSFSGISKDERRRVYIEVTKDKNNQPIKRKVIIEKKRARQKKIAEACVTALVPFEKILKSGKPNTDFLAQMTILENLKERLDNPVNGLHKSTRLRHIVSELAWKMRGLAFQYSLRGDGAVYSYKPRSLSALQRYQPGLLGAVSIRKKIAKNACELLESLPETPLSTPENKHIFLVAYLQLKHWLSKLKKDSRAKNLKAHLTHEADRLASYLTEADRDVAAVKERNFDDFNRLAQSGATDENLSDFIKALKARHCSIEAWLPNGTKDLLQMLAVYFSGIASGALSLEYAYFDVLKTSLLMAKESKVDKETKKLIKAYFLLIYVYKDLSSSARVPSLLDVLKVLKRMGLTDSYRDLLAGDLVRFVKLQLSSRFGAMLNKGVLDALSRDEPGVLTINAHKSLLSALDARILISVQEALVHAFDGYDPSLAASIKLIDQLDHLVGRLNAFWKYSVVQKRMRSNSVLSGFKIKLQSTVKQALDNAMDQARLSDNIVLKIALYQYMQKGAFQAFGFICPDDKKRSAFIKAREEERQPVFYKVYLHLLLRAPENETKQSVEARRKLLCNFLQQKAGEEKNTGRALAEYCSQKHGSMANIFLEQVKKLSSQAICVLLKEDQPSYSLLQACGIDQLQNFLSWLMQADDLEKNQKNSLIDATLDELLSCSLLNNAKKDPFVEGLESLAVAESLSDEVKRKLAGRVYEKQIQRSKQLFKNKAYDVKVLLDIMEAIFIENSYVKKYFTKAFKKASLDAWSANVFKLANKRIEYFLPAFVRLLNNTPGDLTTTQSVSVPNGNDDDPFRKKALDNIIQGLEEANVTSLALEVVSTLFLEASKLEATNLTMSDIQRYENANIAFLARYMCHHHYLDDLSITALRQYFLENFTWIPKKEDREKAFYRAFLASIMLYCDTGQAQKVELSDASLSFLLKNKQSAQGLLDDAKLVNTLFSKLEGAQIQALLSFIVHVYSEEAQVAEEGPRVFDGADAVLMQYLKGLSESEGRISFLRLLAIALSSVDIEKDAGIKALLKAIRSQYKEDKAILSELNCITNLNALLWMKDDSVNALSSCLEKDFKTYEDFYGLLKSILALCEKETVRSGKEINWFVMIGLTCEKFLTSKFKDRQGSAKLSSTLQQLKAVLKKMIDGKNDINLNNSPRYIVAWQQAENARIGHCSQKNINTIKYYIARLKSFESTITLDEHKKALTLVAKINSSGNVEIIASIAQQVDTLAQNTPSVADICHLMREVRWTGEALTFRQHGEREIFLRYNTLCSLYQQIKHSDLVPNDKLAREMVCMRQYIDRLSCDPQEGETQPAIHAMHKAIQDVLAKTIEKQKRYTPLTTLLLKSPLATNWQWYLYRQMNLLRPRENLQVMFDEAKKTAVNNLTDQEVFEAMGRANLKARFNLHDAQLAAVFLLHTDTWKKKKKNVLAIEKYVDQCLCEIILEKLPEDSTAYWMAKLFGSEPQLRYLQQIALLNRMCQDRPCVDKNDKFVVMIQQKIKAVSRKKSNADFVKEIVDDTVTTAVQHILTNKLIETDRDAKCVFAWHSQHKFFDAQQENKGIDAAKQVYDGFVEGLQRDASKFLSDLKQGIHMDLATLHERKGMADLVPGVSAREDVDDLYKIYRQFSEEKTTLQRWFAALSEQEYGFLRSDENQIIKTTYNHWTKAVSDPLLKKDRSIMASFLHCYMDFCKKYSDEYNEILHEWGGAIAKTKIAPYNVEIFKVLPSCKQDLIKKSIEVKKLSAFSEGLSATQKDTLLFSLADFDENMQAKLTASAAMYKKGDGLYDEDIHQHITQLQSAIGSAEACIEVKCQQWFQVASCRLMKLLLLKKTAKILGRSSVVNHLESLMQQVRFKQEFQGIVDAIFKDTLIKTTAGIDWSGGVAKAGASSTTFAVVKTLVPEAINFDVLNHLLSSALKIQDFNFDAVFEHVRQFAASVKNVGRLAHYLDEDKKGHALCIKPKDTEANKRTILLLGCLSAEQKDTLREAVKKRASPRTKTSMLKK